RNGVFAPSMPDPSVPAGTQTVPPRKYHSQDAPAPVTETLAENASPSQIVASPDVAITSGGSPTDNCVTVLGTGDPQLPVAMQRYRPAAVDVRFESTSV